MPIREVEAEWKGNFIGGAGRLILGGGAFEGPYSFKRNLRNNARALDSLFPSVRQGVLAATLGRPEKWWYLSELANFLHTRPSSLQRELSSLEQSGILQQRKDGRRTYFKAETRSPIFRELRSIFEKTVGLIPTLKLALGPFANKITCVFVYGSIARREEHATSDVDLMVIGTVGLGDLGLSLRKAEKRLGREVNVTNYSGGRIPQESRRWRPLFDICAEKQSAVRER